MLRRANLPEDLFSRADVRLRTDEYFALWEGLGREVADPLLPIRIVEVATAETFQPALFAALCSPDLTTGMQRLGQYKRLVAPMALDVEATVEGLSVTFRWLDATVDPPASLSAMEVAFITSLARMGTRERVRPIAVTAPEPPKPARAYERFFGVPVEVGSELSLTFSAEDARRPFLTSNDAVWKAFEPELRRASPNLRSRLRPRNASGRRCSNRCRAERPRRSAWLGGWP